MQNENRPAPQRKPSIGVMIGSFHTDYSRLLVRAICHALKGEADCTIYQGFDASRFLPLDPYVNENYDWHYYSQYEYAKFLRTDLLIISFGTISAVNNAVSFERFMAALPRVPVILIEDARQTPNSWYVTVNNYSGMKKCLEHLIEVHGCRRILFVAGPEDVHDAELRLRAYQDTMRAHGLELCADMIGQGDFTDQVDSVIEGLLARYPRPDAIVCANDEMAECAYRILNAHGLRPGEDVAVTGFDDNAAAAHMEPPLTTVRQPKGQIAEAAAGLARHILRGERPASVSIEPELICRCSCGCRFRNIGADGLQLQNISSYELERRARKAYEREAILSSLVLRNLLRENMSVHDFFSYLGQSLYAMGLSRSWVALLKEPMLIDGHEPFFLPGELRLHMVQNRGETRVWTRRDAPLVSAFRPGGLDPEIGQECPAVVFPLFCDNLHYGVFVAQFQEHERVFYYALALELGTGLRYLYMALNEQAARAALEEKNQILDFSASHDSLTGLYNRVGVMNEIYAFVRAIGAGRRFVIVMGDLDHLKQINDTFGHSGGDTAIRTAASLLRRALPSGAILGRIGGDEFLALFLETEECTAEGFEAQLREQCRLSDERSGLPYFIGVTTGCCSFRGGDASVIQPVIKKADARLYENKRFRRPSIIKPNKK